MAISGKIGQRLIDIKDALESKKAKRSELQGELKGLMSRLKEYNVTTLEEAGALIKKQESELKEAETTIQKQIEDLEEMLDD